MEDWMVVMREKLAAAWGDLPVSSPKGPEGGGTAWLTLQEYQDCNTCPQYRASQGGYRGYFIILCCSADRFTCCGYGCGRG
jgi:hypothetical protein